MSLMGMAHGCLLSILRTGLSISNAIPGVLIAGINRWRLCMSNVNPLLRSQRKKSRFKAMRNAKLIALLAAVLLCGCDDKLCNKTPVVNVPEPSSLQLLAMGFI